MLKPLLLLLLLIPVVCFSQLKITGRVIDKRYKNPVVNARVFLTKDTTKYKTDNYGVFTIPNVKPGEYTLVVTSTDYETYANTWLVYDNSITIPDISLLRLDELDLVNDKYNTNRERDINIFKAFFIGESTNAKKCKILNPDAIFVKYNSILKALIAFSDEYINVENRALGYLIKYKLGTFHYLSNGLVYFEGTPQFEELTGSESEKKRWKKQRLITYQGSSMHFLRSAITNQLEEEGFKVSRLIRKPDTDYYKLTNQQSIKSIYKGESLPVDSFINHTNKKGVFAMKFNDCLYIIYTKKVQSPNINKIGFTAKLPNYATTIITFNEPYALFGIEGIITNPQSISFEGDWGESGIANLLPPDYQP
ncbi:carboxypeptidase-like regulatory domain-containing protein [Mucilaginibacter sp.]|uniref:carboxypeptidase-like regulatory domain-containing protein n=1 Tax=Mucilaginibacter sp. TaxID=1882438 RepID=UPI0025F6C3BC|nr:carboxypeptidase-like regulatory domain-containing protein [Mucilaginibacter sp.]